MPRRKANPFDKKAGAQTFTLVHRAQNDPLIHDQDAPSMVFTSKQPTQQQARRPTEEDYAYSNVGSVNSAAGSVYSSTSDTGTGGYRSKKIKQRGDLEEEFGLAVRNNEGEAAEHGVFFDDSEYDYMQHMRDLGSGEGGVAWIDAAASPSQQQGKRKEKLEDALRAMDLRSESGNSSSRFDDATTSSSAAKSFLPESLLPSSFVRKRTYQDQQDIPDEIAGFQPDMDPELREALMALEDEEYIDDNDEDGEGLFGELVVDGYEIDKGEFERIGEQGGLFEEEGEGEGWESDDTIKGRNSPPPPLPADTPISDPDAAQDLEPAAPPQDTELQPPADPTGGAWLTEFQKFKTASKTPTPAAGPQASLASAQRKLASRKTKSKYASTTTTASRPRTEAELLLDARFEKLVEREYNNDFSEEGQFDDALSTTSALSAGPSNAPSNASRFSQYSLASGDAGAPRSTRSDFDGLIDEFLDSTSRVGKRGKRLRRMGEQTGMEQLDEVRRGLGPARVGRSVVK